MNSANMEKEGNYKRCVRDQCLINFEEQMFVTSQIVLVCFVRDFSVFDRTQDEKHSEEVSHFQEELADAHAQLQILQKQLDDELSKQPVTNQEVQLKT